MFQRPGKVIVNKTRMSDEDLKKFCEKYKAELYKKIKEELSKHLLEESNKKNITILAFPGLLDLNKHDGKLIKSILQKLQEKIEANRSLSEDDINEFVRCVIEEPKAEVFHKYRRLYSPVAKYKAVSGLLENFDDPANLRLVYTKKHSLLSLFRKESEVDILLSSFFAKLAAERAPQTRESSILKTHKKAC